VTSVATSVDVGVDPATAFGVFVDEIDARYRVERDTVVDLTRTVAIRFEPRLGGRLMDVYDAATGEGREMGRITGWEPGRRLVFTDNRGTEVEVTFGAVALGTRVTIEHRGLDRLEPAMADHVRRFGWGLLLPWYRRHVDTRRSDEMAFLGITPYLYYEDGAAALDWLARVFGFGRTQRRTGADGRVDEAEIEVGPARVMISGRAPGPQNGPGALLVVDVDDVDALHARITAAGVACDAPRDEVYGPRTCNVTDPWGYHWYFWQGDARY
jgi:uncharacterized glyoxalase superfamily protein PhnB/uncharacterized protein YndB with AHSA1/START domain